MSSRRLRCGFRGCTFATDDVGELAAHDVNTGHPNPAGNLLEVAVTRIEQLCEEMGGHEPAPECPTLCRICCAVIGGALHV
jgi:hypothetical protein